MDCPRCHERIPSLSCTECGGEVPEGGRYCCWCGKLMPSTEKGQVDFSERVVCSGIRNLPLHFGDQLGTRPVSTPSTFNRFRLFTFVTTTDLGTSRKMLTRETPPLLSRVGSWC